MNRRTALRGILGALAAPLGLLSLPSDRRRVVTAANIDNTARDLIRGRWVQLMAPVQRDEGFVFATDASLPLPIAPGHEEIRVWVAGGWYYYGGQRFRTTTEVVNRHRSIRATDRYFSAHGRAERRKQWRRDEQELR